MRHKSILRRFIQSPMLWFCIPAGILIQIADKSEALGMSERAKTLVLFVATVLNVVVIPALRLLDVANEHDRLTRARMRP